MKNRKSSLTYGIILLISGGIFAAIGLGLIVIATKEIVKSGIGTIGAGIIFPIIFILAFLGVGITALTFGGKQIYLRIRQSRTYVHGKEVIAKVVDYKSASFGKDHNTRIRYALVLAYDEDGEDKIFTTDYLYDVNEFRYLSGLGSINVKVDGNFVAVVEPFPKDIYKVDSTWGIDVAFFKQKPVAILMRLWIIFFIAAIIFLIASFFIKVSNITMAAVIILFTVHFPFAIPLSIYLIRWFMGKK